MNIFYLKNIFYEHSKNEKLNYLQLSKLTLPHTPPTWKMASRHFTWKYVKIPIFSK